MSDRLEAAQRRPWPPPSVNFLVLVLVFAGTGSVLWHGWTSGRVAVVLFVLSGWVVSLCLHEFAHAATAHAGGDARVVETGYLTFDPFKYTDPMLSLFLPLLFIFLGGIGLPGGAVWIRSDMLRSRGWVSAVAAAGPLANVLCLLALGALYAMMPHGEEPTGLEAGVGALAFFQATAVVLNLVPLPGLDGFGIIRPWLPIHVAVRANQIGAIAFVILLLLMWYTPFGRVLFESGLIGANAVGIDAPAVVDGIQMMRFR